MIFTEDTSYGLHPDPENAVPEIYYLPLRFYCAITELWIENTVNYGSREIRLDGCAAFSPQIYGN